MTLLSSLSMLSLTAFHLASGCDLWSDPTRPVLRTNRPSLTALPSFKENKQIHDVHDDDLSLSGLPHVGVQHGPEHRRSVAEKVPVDSKCYSWENFSTRIRARVVFSSRLRETSSFRSFLLLQNWIILRSILVLYFKKKANKHFVYLSTFIWNISIPVFSLYNNKKGTIIIIREGFKEKKSVLTRI